ncbi:MAG TPA: c-type cytochrome [Agriterribacter sp.]|nr:c-type cytochrome [Agriterribacter sp.]
MKSFVTIAAFALVLFSCNNDKSPATAAGPVDPKVEKLKLPAGFHAERLFGPSENEDGSWVSMTFDDKGRIIASDQYGALYRLKVPAIGDTGKTTIEKLIITTDTTSASDTTQKASIGFAHGLLYAFNSLYVMVNNRNKDAMLRQSGLYRLQDTDGDDQFDKVTLLKSLEGDGEHGPHSVILAPDKKSLYVVCGNHTNIPTLDAYRLPSNWKEDNLFPLITDPNGHATDRRAPGGWIAKVDPESNRWEQISSGYRNPFDIAFNAAGDLFTYDSDMEWDFGTPWYRPTRICHVTSGSEYGWRTGNSKWSPAYPDNLPPVLNIGQGSPTNLMYGGKARFPEKYKNTLFAFDWSFGIIYAIHLEPNGASYKATGEEFLSGSPLPLTDGAIGPDGAMYFLTGGRRLESDFYRVYYKDNKEPATDDIAGSKVEETPESKLRKELEAFHGDPKPGAIELAWPNLKHSDRFVRYAARIAVEHQPVKEWQQKALDEKDPVIATNALIALARQGGAGLGSQIINSLTAIDYKGLSESQQVDIARAFELVFLRMGQPDAATKQKAIAYLDPQYPAKTNELNRELSKVLVYLEAPKAVEKTMALLATAKDEDTQKTFTSSSDLIMRNPQYGMDIANMLSKVPPQQQTYYANVLSEAKTGWTPELREKYFQWFYSAFSYKGGHSFRGFINKSRTNALANVPKSEFAHFNTISGDSIANRSGNEMADAAVQPKGPGKNWKMEDALPVIDSGLTNRNFDQGKAMFAASMCISCHTMKGEGGVSGPDLTQVGTRFSPKDMLEAIIDPSKTISDQYGSTIFYLKDGGSVLGRLIKEEGANYVISQNPFAPQVVREIPKADVTRTRVSDVSPMLPGMINRLNNEELKDLIAYLMAGGNKDSEVYTGKK